MYILHNYDLSKQILLVLRIMRWGLYGLDLFVPAQIYFELFVMFLTQFLNKHRCGSELVSQISMLKEANNK